MTPRPRRPLRRSRAPGGGGPCGPGVERVARRLPLQLVAPPGGAGVAVGWPARRTPFEDGYACWKGSFWMAASRPAVRALLDALSPDSDLVAHYRRTVHPDESAWATVLANEPSLRVSGEPLRHVVWRAGARHPETLTLADLEAVDRSGAYLARKFDLDAAPAVIEALEQRLATARDATPTPS